MFRHERVAPAFAAFWAAALVLATVVVVDTSETSRHKAQVEADADRAVGQIGDRLERGLADRVGALEGVTAFVLANDGRIDGGEFSDFAQGLITGHSGIRGVVLAPDGMVTHTYPAAAAEAYEGGSVAADDAHAQAIARAEQTGRAAVAGPFGEGERAWLAAYAAIPTADDSGTWGYAALLLDMDPLLWEAGVFDEVADHDILIQAPDAVVFGDPGVLTGEPSVSEAVVPGAIWTLTAVPVDGWPTTSPIAGVLRAGGVMLAGLVAVLAYTFVSEPARLQQRVDEATIALRESNERFKAVTANANDAIITMDLQGRVEHVNPATHEMFGHDAAYLEGRELTKLLAEEDATAVATGLDTYLASGHSQVVGRPFEVSARTADGGGFPAEVSISSWRASDGVHFTAIIRDITERRRAEHERALAFERLTEIKQLKEVNELKTRLLNTASHELNTPITPIKLQLHMLKEAGHGELNEAQKRAVTILDRNVERLAGLIKDILDVARLQGDRLKVEPRRVDLDSVITECVESFDGAAASGQVTLENGLAGGIWVNADPARVHQVMFNLLSNALKFTPPGGRIRVETGVAEDGLAVVHVRDTGEGLDPEDLARLFKPFSQAHDHLQRTDAGTGLGLYISKGIVEHHGGRIWCESAGRGQGATFSFTLPVHRADPIRTRGDQWGTEGEGRAHA